MIPKIIHHIAPKDRSKWHPVWEKCYRTWLHHYPEPEYTHMLWDDDQDLEKLVKDHFPQYLDVYLNMKKHIMRIDFAKAVMVYAYGGMYVDMDFMCLENFHYDLRNNVILSLSPYHELGEPLQNAMYAATPKHPFTEAWATDMVNNCLNKDPKSFKLIGQYICYTTGPQALRLTHLRHHRFKEEIQLLPYEIYNPHFDEIRKISEEGSTTHNFKCAHLLSSVWGKEELLTPREAKKFYEDWRDIRLDNI